MKNYQYQTSELLFVFPIVTAMRLTGSHCRVLLCKSLWPLFEIPISLQDICFALQASSVL